MSDDNDDAPDRRSRILGGARVAFLRYGFERASMADIASGAGVSRTALYHYFPSKEDVLRAVVDDFHTRTLNAAAKALDEGQTLNAALSGLLKAKIGPTLALITESPHGVELVEATRRLTAPAIIAADQGLHALVVKALQRHGRPEEADAVADTLVAAARGLMHSGEDHVPKARFEERIQRLVAWATK